MSQFVMVPNSRGDAWIGAGLNFQDVAKRIKTMQKVALKLIKCLEEMKKYKVTSLTKVSKELQLILHLFSRIKNNQESIKRPRS